MTPAFVPVGTPHGAGSLPRLWSRRGWAFIGIAALVLFVVVPVCNLLVPAGSVFHLSDYTVTLVARGTTTGAASTALTLRRSGPSSRRCPAAASG